MVPATHQLIKFLNDFDSESQADLRARVQALIPIWDELKNLGTSLIPSVVAKSARDRILYYLQRYPREIISHKEIMIVAGISEWARRVRELRVQFGWSIMSGITAQEMQEAGELNCNGDMPDCSVMKPEDYILIDLNEDREAAHRWNIANEIRRRRGGAKAHILEYLRRNIGRSVTGEELRYVAGNAAEWARRVRELRTEDGWPVRTRQNGRPDLVNGTYVLEKDRQAPVHDRRIDDNVRREVLVRDRYSCRDCTWSREKWTADDPRYLELHHVKHHATGGDNSVENLTTLCNVCHDVTHKKGAA
jgi:5-methylcytosine-specific restriction endonuclease McrA